MDSVKKMNKINKDLEEALVILSKHKMDEGDLKKIFFLASIYPSIFKNADLSDASKIRELQSKIRSILVQNKAKSSTLEKIFKNTAFSWLSLVATVGGFVFMFDSIFKINQLIGVLIAFGIISLFIITTRFFHKE